MSTQIVYSNSMILHDKNTGLSHRIRFLKKKTFEMKYSFQKSIYTKTRYFLIILEKLLFYFSFRITAFFIIIVQLFKTIKMYDLPLSQEK